MFDCILQLLNVTGCRPNIKGVTKMERIKKVPTLHIKIFWISAYLVPLKILLSSYGSNSVLIKFAVFVLKLVFNSIILYIKQSSNTTYSVYLITIDIQGYQFRSFVDHLQALTYRTSERVGLGIKNNKIHVQVQN